MKRILTIGSFAIPHIGHAAFLQASAEYGDLTVGINSDAFVARYKGSAAPFNEDERMALIASLGYQVRLSDGPGCDMIRELRPDILTIGSDWLSRDYYRQIDFGPDDFEELGITLTYIPMRPAGISSTEVMRRCRA